MEETRMLRRRRYHRPFTAKLLDIVTEEIQERLWELKTPKALRAKMLEIANNDRYWNDLEGIVAITQRLGKRINKHAKNS
jgi:hypothetical protein